MTQADRREFLRKLAGGVAYSAPVVYSMAAPMDLVAQSGKGKAEPSAKGKDWMGSSVAVPPPSSPPPPGNRPPGGGG
jgi:hypothetical protein